MIAGNFETGRCTCGATGCPSACEGFYSSTTFTEDYSLTIEEVDDKYYNPCLAYLYSPQKFRSFSSTIKHYYRKSMFDKSGYLPRKIKAIRKSNG